MKKILYLLGLLLFVNSLYSQTAVTNSNLHLRETANNSSKDLSVIPKGTILQIEACNNDWCRTRYNGLTGYINSNYIRYSNADTSGSQAVKPVQKTEVKYYKNSAGEKIQSPTYYETPPAGATALCRDGTYSFSTSRRGTCSHHGGVKKWL